MKFASFSFLLLFPGIIFAESIPGDINGDGEVGFADFLILAQNFGKKGEAGLSSGSSLVGVYEYLHNISPDGETAKRNIIEYHTGERKDDSGVMVITQTQMLRVMFRAAWSQGLWLLLGSPITSVQWQRHTTTDSTFIVNHLAYDAPQDTIAYSLTDSLLTINNPGTGKVAWKKIAP